MSIFNRIFKIGQAGFNQAIDKLETPELMLDQAIRDKEKQIKEAKQAVLACIATEKQTKALLDREKLEQGNWEDKAEAALKAGREDLAVKALARAAEHEKKAEEMEPHCREQRTQIESLKQDIRRIEDELAEFKRNRDFIIAQSKAAEVKKQIYQAKARISGKHNADDLMARMRAKAERRSHEAEAALEMAGDSGDSLENEFADLGSAGADRAVSDKLAALKARIGA
ncbi:MAG: PspA/IM30 family protein [Deltaproteobacteria bacterium]|nr:PspA/IM30 family protein [Deltaproteobacteria bacterium]